MVSAQEVRFDHTPNAGRGTQLSDFSTLPLGHLVAVNVFAKSVVTRKGEVFATVKLRYQKLPVTQLCRGYVHSGSDPAWVGDVPIIGNDFDLSITTIATVANVLQVHGVIEPP